MRRMWPHGQVISYVLQIRYKLFSVTVCDIITKQLYQSCTVLHALFYDQPLSKLEWTTHSDGRSRLQASSACA